MWYDKLFEITEAEKDEQQAKKMSAYMKEQFSFLGVPKPILNKIIKPFINKQAKCMSVEWDFIWYCWEKEYREAQYIAIEYIYLIEKKLTDEDIIKLKQLIITKSWWDTVDGLDNVIGRLSLRYPSIKDKMVFWSKSDNIWLRRVAINYQQRFKERTDKNILERIICNNFGTDEFFINKAIGWSLRDYSKTNPVWVKSFIYKYKQELSKLSIREASKFCKQTQFRSRNRL